MKIRIIKLTPQSLIQAVQGKAASLVPNLPDDAELLDIKYDLFTRQVTAIVRSDKFEDVPESYPIPELNITHTATHKTTFQPVTNLKTEFKSPISLKLERTPVTKTQQQPSQYATKMEEEFSPEQRKLLSFKVEADYVIVKPTQFLKAEWEDINEVVRSLGGKWVKGDIISYWAIPVQQD